MARRPSVIGVLQGFTTGWCQTEISHVLELADDVYHDVHHVEYDVVHRKHYVTQKLVPFIVGYR